MSDRNEPLVVAVPLLEKLPLEPPPKARIRALKRHLIASLRALRTARRPDRMIQPSTPVPQGFTATVLREGCATCGGHCCKGGGDHAYLDERTMARVRRDHPGLNAAAIIRLFLERVAPASPRGSCLFHGALGCTLGRGRRAWLCDAYHCNGLLDFMRLSPVPDRARIVAARNGRERRSIVLALVVPIEKT